MLFSIMKLIFLFVLTLSNLVEGLKPTILKCKCKANQVLNDGNCEDGITTKLIVLYRGQSHPSVVETEEFGLINVRDVTCDVHTNSASFLLFENGNLYNYANHREFSTNEFCVEHVKVNDSLSLNAKICQRVPTISQCCPRGFILNSAFQCTPETNFTFEVPFSDGMTWKNLSGRIQKIDKCPKGFKLHSANISEPRALFSLSVSDVNEALLKSAPRRFELNRKFNSSEFCVAARKTPYNYFYEAFYCSEDRQIGQKEICPKTPCFRKCCPVNAIYSNEYKVCVRNYLNLTLPFSKDRNGFSFEHPTNKSFDQHIVIGAPFCDDYVVVESSEGNDTPIVLSNGYLYVRSLAKHFSPAHYCVEHEGSGNSYEEKAYVCPETTCGWRYLVVSSLVGISSIFLCVTLVIYIGIKDLRTRMSGKCLISELSSLLVAYLTLIIIQTAPHHLSSLGCRISGIVQHISILASFFWLNVMCYDMWSTIRSNRPIDDESRTNFRFALYSLYGWGSSLFIGIVAVIVDNLPELENIILRPRIGERSCYFADKPSQWAYLYSIIVILLLIDLAFFVHIAVILMKAQKASKKMFSQGRSAGGNKNDTRERCLTYAKLFIVMGISWAAEVLSFEAETHSDSCIFWLPTDIINALRGIFIFLIFVCKKRTLNKIMNAWCPTFIPKQRSFFRMHSNNGESKTQVSNASGAFYNSANTKVSIISSNDAKGIKEVSPSQNDRSREDHQQATQQEQAQNKEQQEGQKQNGQNQSLD